MRNSKNNLIRTIVALVGAGFISLVLGAPVLAQPVHGHDPQRLCGWEPLRDPEFLRQAWDRTLRAKPGLLDAVRGKALRKTDGPLFVGAVEVFWTFDYTGSVFDTVSAELRATGTECNVWVSLAELANGHVWDSDVTVILEALEASTPAASRDSSKGIVDIVRTFYGDPPNIDAGFVKGAGDGMTDFLILDIEDGWSAGGSYIAGYFFDVDVDPASGFTAFSNRRDMLYIDSYPGITSGGAHEPGRPVPVLSHEFQHLVNWNYNPGQISFLNEGLSEYSEYLCGYGLRSSALYLESPNVPLLSWSNELSDYSRAALWTLYTGEQFGDLFIQRLTQNPQGGTSGFDEALAQAGVLSSFSEAARGFFVANIVQDKSAGPRYGYSDQAVLGGKPPIARDVLGANASIGRTGLEPLAAEYVRFRAVDTLRMIVASGSAPLNISAASFDDQGVTVVGVPGGAEYERSYVGSARSEMILVVQNASQGLPSSYTVTAFGSTRRGAAVELGYDDGTSLTTSNTLLRSGDTVFVVFDGVLGGRVDSVRMWFETTGAASVFFRDANPLFDIDLNPAGGLGGAARMTGGPVPVTVSRTGFLETVVDVRQKNIVTDGDFVLEVIYGAGGPNPLLRRDNAQFISRSFLSIASQPTPGRTIYESFGDFYVRVYASPTDGTIPPQQEIPSSFQLYANYPNPFNPATTIRYDLASDVDVRLTVFDIVGREVVTLVDGFQPAGEYFKVWDGTGGSGVAASGVYFYRLTAGSSVMTRAMVLVR